MTLNTTFEVYSVTLTTWECGGVAVLYGRKGEGKVKQGASFFDHTFIHLIVENRLCLCVCVCEERERERIVCLLAYIPCRQLVTSGTF